MEVSTALEDLPDLPLEHVLSFLPALDLFKMSSLSKRMALAAEAIFFQRNRQHGWRPPRRPRNRDAEPKLFPERYLCSKHSCVMCKEPGGFLVLPPRIQGKEGPE